MPALTSSLTIQMTKGRTLIHKYTTMPDNKKFPFKLGADPEFNFVVQNRQSGRLRADALMKDFFRDKRSTSSGGFDIPGGNAGWDGNSSTGEIRPEPANSPKGLTENIGKLYSEICKRSPQAVKLSVRCDTAPVGGHIHFELDDVSKEMSDQKARIVQKRLSTFYVPIALGEDPANQLLRLHTSYGKFSDFRRENGKTYEYRTPSAEWQLTPKISEATLAYLGTVWYEAVHRPASFKKLETVYSNDQAGNSIQQLLVHNYAPLGRTIVADIKKVIRNFEYYPMFKEEIDYILNYEKVLKDKQKSMYCINLGWGFQELKQPTKKIINNEAQIRKSLANIDIDRWLELFKVPHNPDTNVKDFVDALKKRILAYDWNLKNEYFMFGMKKGIEKPIAMNGNFAFIAGKDQVQTVKDNQAIVGTFQRMKQRMQRAFSTPADRSILLGLPYDMRMKKDIRPVIDLIYDIERSPENFKPVMPKTENLIDDTNQPVDKIGSIARAYINGDQDEPMIIEEANQNRYGAASRFDPELYVEDDNDDDDECHDDDNKHRVIAIGDTARAYLAWCGRNSMSASSRGFEEWVDNHAYDI